MYRLCIGILVFLPLMAMAQSPIDSKTSIDSSFGTVVDQCGIKGAAKHVWIFKQWHLSPGVNTNMPHANPPQKENQTAIFRQLESWIDKNNLDTIFSEGCTGEITDSFSKTYNGWTFKDLSDHYKSVVKSPEKASEFDEIVTLVPLKLKAKYRDKIKVFCADDEKIIEKQNEALSDARGSLGFLTRIEQLKKDPTRLKPYLNSVIQMDHLPAHSSIEVVLKKLNSDLKDEVKRAKKGLDDRNQIFVMGINKNAPAESAFVVGGLHASGLVDLLKQKGVDCSVVEPKGYPNNDEKLFSVAEPGHK